MMNWKVLKVVCVGVVSLFLAGCVTNKSVGSASPKLQSYSRVAIMARIDPKIESVFLPRYMVAFPKQTIVERRDVDAILEEQDILPERLNEETRARLRRVLGVEVLVFPDYTVRRAGAESFSGNALLHRFSIKLIDAETGAIVASAFVSEKGADGGIKAARKAVDIVKRKSKQ